MKMNEVRDLTDQELKDSLIARRKELLDLRIQSRVGQLENPSRVKQCKKEIARLLTWQNIKKEEEK